MAWKAMTESELGDEINAAWDRMSAEQKRLWASIRIEPTKWVQHPYGDQGGGFWAVAILGQTVVWYNDIEDGFNRSRYARWGEIGEYSCDQNQLEWAVQCLLDEIDGKRPAVDQKGPPQSLC